MTRKHDPNSGNLSPSIRVQITDGDPLAQNLPSAGINNNHKSCICYGNAVIGTVMFLFSFCSIVFIVIFVEYRELTIVEETSTIISELTGVDELGAIDVKEMAKSKADAIDEKLEESFLEAIENKAADQDESNLDDYDELISAMNITKMILPVLELEQPDKVLHYMTRNEWQSNDEASTKMIAVDLILPVNRVIVAHTAGKSCNSTFNCSRILQSIQAEHASSGKGIIGYNFLIGGNGVIFEGRGWDKAGVHTPNNDQDSVCIALIGNFNEKKPSDEQVRALRNVIEWGATLGKLDKDYKLFAHRQLMQPLTDSPGTMVYEIIESWPHFTASPAMATVAATIVTSTTTTATATTTTAATTLSVE